MSRYLPLLFLILSHFTNAQLLPSIGLISKPGDATSLCKEPYYLGSYYTSGYQQGDTVPDFKLYSLNGDSLQLSQALSGGKPVLLVSGSLTCPVFRSKVPFINQVMATYSNNIAVYVIYCIEAHPTDTSVYFGYPNVTSQNTSAGILVPNPTTYGQRKALVDSLNYRVNLNAPVFIDGPCNQWWKKFGPAPNNSYLIGTNGVVMNKHGWFHKNPDNIFCDFDSIFSVNSGSCISTPTAPGNFSLTLLNDTAYGGPGKTLYDYVDIVNSSTVAVNIKIKKIQSDLPAGWQTAFCADVCYSTADDSVEVQIAANSTINFSLDFFTDMITDTGSVRVGFKNLDKSSNSFSLWLHAITSSPDISVRDLPELIFPFSLYPNPCVDRIHLKTEEKEFVLKVHTVTGNMIFSSKNTPVIETQEWPADIYFLQYESAKGCYRARFIVAH
jgi:hypothetical protein